MDLSQMSCYEPPMASPINSTLELEQVALGISPTGDSHESSHLNGGHDEREAGIRQHNEQRVARTFSNVGVSIENQPSSRIHSGMPPLSPTGQRLSQS